jgi:hypothetical protein
LNDLAHGLRHLRRNSVRFWRASLMKAANNGGRSQTINRRTAASSDG